MTRKVPGVAIAGGNDEVWETDVSSKRVHTTWMDDATMTRTSHVFNETSLKSMSRGGVREDQA